MSVFTKGLNNVKALKLEYEGLLGQRNDIDSAYMDQWNLVEGQRMDRSATIGALSTAFGEVTHRMDEIFSELVKIDTNESRSLAQHIVDSELAGTQKKIEKWDNIRKRVYEGKSRIIFSNATTTDNYHVTDEYYEILLRRKEKYEKFKAML